MLDVIDDIVDELYYEIMVGPEAFEVTPLTKVVLDRLAVSFFGVVDASSLLFVVFCRFLSSKQ